MSAYQSSSNLFFLGVTIWANRLIRTIFPPIFVLTIVAFLVPLIAPDYLGGTFHHAFIVTIFTLMLSWALLGFNAVSILVLHFLSRVAGWRWSDDELAL